MREVTYDRFVFNNCSCVDNAPRAYARHGSDMGVMANKATRPQCGAGTYRGRWGYKGRQRIARTKRPFDLLTPTFVGTCSRENYPSGGQTVRESS
ncbi:hypothetical protein D3C71_1879900 [compost metagenome]